MCVFNIDTLVVEGWSSCLLVGFVEVFWDKICDFGELILSEIALPGDLEWIVRQLCFEIKPPIDHAALVF